MSYTLEEKLERLHEMKREPFARCSIEQLGATMDPAESWSALVEQHIYAEIIDVYLRNYVAPGEENRCPFCGVGFFGWGLVHGEGNCSCGWPATLYHRIRDRREDGDLLCDDADCGRRRDEHVPTEGVYGRVELRCPEQGEDFPQKFQPPLIVGFTRLLWAHPYSVHLRPRKGQ